MSAQGNHLQTLGVELAKLEREDPEVAAAAASLSRTVDRIVGRGPALGFAEVRRIYDLSSDQSGNATD